MTPETIEQFIQKKVEEILAKYPSNTQQALKGVIGMVCEFRSVQKLVDYVEKEAWKRARKILEENGA